MASETPERFNPEEKRILVFTGVAHALTHYVELTYPALAVVMAPAVGLPVEEVLSWSLAGYLLFGLGALPVGYLSDRFGGRIFVLGGLGLAGMSAFMAAFATPGWPIALCLAGIGLGASAYHPAGMGLISRAVDARGAALGINGVYGNIGVASAPLVTALLAQNFGWRMALGVTGAGILASTFIMSLLRFEEPAPIPAPHAEEESEPIPRRQILAFGVLCGTAMLAGFNYRANTSSMPEYFAQRIDLLDYGLAVSIAMVMGILAQYIGGICADRFRLTWAYAAFHAASLPMMIWMSSAFELPLLIAGALYVSAALGMQPIENSLFAELTPERWRSTAYGLKFALVFGVGSSAIPWIEQVGVIEVYHWLVYPIVGVITGALVLIGLTSRLGKPPAGG